MSIFECNKCGKCCTDLLGKFGDIEEDRKITEKSNSQGPIYTLLPVEKHGLILNEWERKECEEKARQLGVELNLQPNGALFDENQNLLLVISWNMMNEQCPFLHDDNYCRIYSSRPIVCKKYPILGLPELDETGTINIASIIGNCPCTDLTLFDIKQGKPSKIRDLFVEYFSESFFYALLERMFLKYSLLLVEELTNANLFKPVKSRPFNYFKKKIQKAKVMGIEEFLLETNIPNKKQLINTRKNLTLEQIKEHYYI
jgi:Fe-S-cluster containining protein